MKTSVIYLFAIAITLLCGCQGQNGPIVTKVKSSEVPAETKAERTMEDNPAEVGTIPDSIDVNKSGEANYVIPIVSPPGTNGMQPSQALNYNSGAGYGYIGQGWSLSGKSVISRCSRSLAIDGYNRSVMFDDKDVFCSDGACSTPAECSINPNIYPINRHE